MPEIERARERARQLEITKHYILRLYATLLGIIVVFGIVFYAWQIASGEATFPDVLRNNLLNFITVVLAAAGPYVVGQMHRSSNAHQEVRITEAVQNQTDRAVLQIEKKLKDGVGEVLASKVVEHLTPRDPESRTRHTDKLSTNMLDDGYETNG